LSGPEYKSLDRGNVGGGWFEVYRIRPGAHAIYEPHQFEEVISYLIIGGRRALLFDTASASPALETLLRGSLRSPSSR
jgi:hypothetical protein